MTRSFYGSLSKMIRFSSQKKHWTSRCPEKSKQIFVMPIPLTDVFSKAQASVFFSNFQVKGIIITRHHCVAKSSKRNCQIQSGYLQLHSKWPTTTFFHQTYNDLPWNCSFLQIGPDGFHVFQRDGFCRSLLVSQRLISPSEVGSLNDVVEHEKRWDFSQVKQWLFCEANLS